jgi:polygalacturonase
MSGNVTAAQLTSDESVLATAVGSLQNTLQTLIAAIQSENANGTVPPSIQAAMNQAHAAMQTTIASLTADIAQATAVTPATPAASPPA